MTSPTYISKMEEAAACMEKTMNGGTNTITSPGPDSSSPKLAGMSVDPDDLSPSDGESTEDDGTQDTSRSSSPNTSTRATHGSESVDDDGQQESSKGSARSPSSSEYDAGPIEYEGRGLRRNNHDFTATFDFIREATRQRKARLSKLEDADGQASVMNASREYLSEYYGWRPARPRRAMPRSNFFHKDLGHEMIAASDCSEHESDKEVEDECEGSGDAYFRRGRAE